MRVLRLLLSAFALLVLPAAGHAFQWSVARDIPSPVPCYLNPSDGYCYMVVAIPGGKKVVTATKVIGSDVWGYTWDYETAKAKSPSFPWSTIPTGQCLPYKDGMCYIVVVLIDKTKVAKAVQIAGDLSKAGSHILSR